MNMKLKELKVPLGTYAALKVLDPGNEQLEQYIKSNAIPNPLAKHKRHVTLLYSRKYLPGFVPEPDLKWIARPIHFDVFESRSKDKITRCLVLKLSAPGLEARFRKLMSEHDATYDFPTYTPHITLSYDIGGMDIGALPPIQQEIILGAEYSEDLDLS